MSGYSIILFFPSTKSIGAARSLKKAGIERRLVPISRALSSECGYCVRISCDDSGRAREALEKGGIEYKEIRELNYN